MSHILCIGGRHHVITPERVVDSIANAFTMHGCFGYTGYDLVGHDLPDIDPEYKLGYLWCDQQSEFGRVIGGTGVVTRNTIQVNLFNPEGAIADFPMFPLGPHNYGRSAHGLFSGLYGVGGGNGSAFSNHAGCYHMTYADCHHVAAGANENSGSDASGRGFANRGDYTQFINCSSVSDRTAMFIFSESDRIGGDIEENYCIGTRIVNFVARDSGLYNVFLNRALDVEIIGGNLHVSRDTTTGARNIFARKSTLSIDSKLVLDFAVSGAQQPAIELENSKLSFDGLEWVVNERILNGSNQLVNYMPNLIKVAPTVAASEDPLTPATTTSKIFGKNLLVNGAVPIGFFVDNTGNVGTSFIQGIDVLVDDIDNIACADAGALRKNGLQGPRPINYGYRDSQQPDGTSKTSLICGVRQFVAGVISDVHRSDVSQNTDVSSFEGQLKYNGEMAIFTTLVPTVNQDVTAMPVGHVLGQKWTIHNNNSGGFTITFHHDCGAHGARIYTKSAADVVMAQHSSITLTWGSAAWYEV